MEKVLIVGGDSLIGKSLRSHWKNKNFDVYSTSRRPDSENQIFFDLQDPVFTDFALEYEYIIFLVGNSNIQDCIDNPALSEQVNVHNSIAALIFFETISSNILFLSSADVFDGSKPRESVHAPHRPKNLYGNQKALVEKFILDESKNITILRLSKVVHFNFKLFLEWEDAVSKKEKIYPYSDKYFSPTELTQVINKIDHIKSHNEIKIHHCYGQNDISYYDYALNYLICDPALIISSKDPSSPTNNFYSSLEEDCCEST